MALRIGLIDVVAVGVTLVAVLLPAPSRPIEPVPIKEALSREILAAQADLVSEPGSGAASRRLVARLIEARQTDGALRVAGQVATAGDPGDRWRSLLALSEAHLERLEIKPAYEWADKALTACNAKGAECAPHERVRLESYTFTLQAGADSGIDPRLDPKAFDAAMKRAIPRVYPGIPRSHKRAAEAPTPEGQAAPLAPPAPAAAPAGSTRTPAPQRQSGSQDP